MLYPLLFVVTYLLQVPTCLADPASYIDATGRTHYVDSLDRVPEKYREQAAKRPALPAINKFDFKSENHSKLKTTTSKANQARKVDVYVTSWCGYCRALEKYLVENKVAFKKHNIERDKSAQRAHAALGGGGIPVTTISSGKGETPRVLRGFNPEALKSALGLK